MRKALVQLLIVGLMGIFGVAYAEDCTSSEGRKRMICDLKGFKKGPPKIMDDACELWVRLTYEIDPALADFQRGLFEEEAGMDLSELLRLRHEAGDQFGAYAIGILQMSREARRYKTCDSGKAQFSWVETYEVAERITRSRARVNKNVFRMILMADAGHHLDELRAAMEEGHLSGDEVMSCVVDVVEGGKVYDINFSVDQWSAEARAAFDKSMKDSERVCHSEVSLYLRPR